MTGHHLVCAYLGKGRLDLGTGVVLSAWTAWTEPTPPVHSIRTRWLILEQGAFPGANLWLRYRGE